MQASSEPKFIQIQKAFAGNIRNPVNTIPIENVADERMAVYRELIFNNIASFLQTSFPVLRSILEDAQWSELVQSFFSRHKSKTPYYSEFAEEFLSFLQFEYSPLPSDPPFLLELALYEWVELALSISDQEQQKEETPSTFPSELLKGKYRLSELAWPLAFRFPVHQISTAFKPMDAPDEPTFIVIFRDKSDRVRFIQLTKSAFLFLKALENDKELSTEHFFENFAEAFKGQLMDGYYDFATTLILELLENEIIFPC